MQRHSIKIRRVSCLTKEFLWNRERKIRKQTSRRKRESYEETHLTLRGIRTKTERWIIVTRGRYWNASGRIKRKGNETLGLQQLVRTWKCFNGSEDWNFRKLS